MAFVPFSVTSVACSLFCFILVTLADVGIDLGLALSGVNALAACVASYVAWRALSDEEQQRHRKRGKDAQG